MRPAAREAGAAVLPRPAKVSVARSPLITMSRTMRFEIGQLLLATECPLTGLE
jgi:hypothetical protein